MKCFASSLIWIIFAILAIAVPSSAEETNFADVEFYLDKTGIGDVYDLSLEEPSANKPKYWKARDDENQVNNYFPLVSWEKNMGGKIELGDSFSYIIWVESTNVQEINFRTTLYIHWIDMSGEEPETRMTNISVDEVSKSSSFGAFLNRNYTMELESSSLDKSDFPDGVPAYTTLGLKLETSITWAPDTSNRTVWVKGGSSEGCGNEDSIVACDSSFLINFRHVDIDEDIKYFNNIRVDEVNSDKLKIKMNVSNALGVGNFDMDSAKLEIKELSNGGTFQNTVEATDKHSYAIYIEGYWFYQKDQNIESNIYTIKISIKDLYGNTWESEISYDLVVDEFGLEIAFQEPYSENGQLPKGGKTVYEFSVYNRGNTRDIFEIEIDDSDLPSGWSVILNSESTLDLLMNQEGYVNLRVEAPFSAAGGSKEELFVKVQSTSNSNVKEEIKLETTVRTYAVIFVSAPNQIVIDPEELNSDGEYKFSINLKNTGSDKDTFRIEISYEAGHSRIEIGGINDIESVTIEEGQIQKLDVILRPSDPTDEAEWGVVTDLIINADSISPGDGSSMLQLGVVVDIPLERISDLSINEDDVLVNNKPLSLITSEDLIAEEPIQIQLTIFNNGGRDTGLFEVRLYIGQGIEDEFVVEQGINGFGSESVILTWSDPSSGPIILRIKVDSDLNIEESNSKRLDNSLTLSLNINEKSLISENVNDADSLLSSPNYLFSILILSIISLVKRKKN